MENIKSLADQIREELKNPQNPPKVKKETAKTVKANKARPPDSSLLAALEVFDTSSNKSMVHVRFDDKTLILMNQFKLASGVDVSKFVAFSVRELIASNPEFKQIIKHFIQKTDL